jgi:hypothetical protein
MEESDGGLIWDTILAYIYLEALNKTKNYLGQDSRPRF